MLLLYKRLYAWDLYYCRRAFEQCDVIITPTLPCTAPPIKPAALVAGESGEQGWSNCLDCFVAVSD